jgi:nitrous oxidase accessory protein NosD
MNRVEEAASILDAAITDNITVNIEVGYGIFPSDSSSVPPQSAEGDPNTGSLFSY